MRPLLSQHIPDGPLKSALLATTLVAPLVPGVPGVPAKLEILPPSSILIIQCSAISVT